MAAGWYTKPMTATKHKPKRRLTKAERDAYAIVGRAGGRATVRKVGKKGMAALGRAGATKRWGKK